MTGLSPHDGRRARLWTAVVALAAAVPTFVVYLRTLYPGVVGTRDTAKFQFVGRVLGTPHNPGYPLYVVLSHVFSYVPIGSLAYRMNVFSAILAALTVAVMTRIFTRLGVPRAAAAGLGVACGLGQTFWSQAILAEVYALGALLLAVVVLCLVEWRATRRDGWLIAGAAVAALALGNHLTIVMVAPAFLVFVALTDWRVLTRPRLIVWTIVCTLLGCAQYLFIMLRTYQGAPYLESHARTLRELIGVMRAEQFQSWVAAYPASQVWHERVPVLWAFTASEFTIAGVALLAAGLLWGWRRDRPVVGLVVAGAAVIFGFAVDYAAPDIEVFLIPAFVLMWLAIALTIARVAALGRAAAIGATAGACVLAASLGVLNWKVNDHHRRTAETEFLRALFAALPDGAAIVSDGPGRDWVLDYALLGEGEGVRRRIVRIPQTNFAITDAVKAGRPVYAFRSAREALADQSIAFEPVRVPGPHLFDEACGAPGGATVVIAGLPAPWLGERDRALACLGAWPDRRGFGGAPLAIVGTVGGEAPQTAAPGDVRAPHFRAWTRGVEAGLEIGGRAESCRDCVLYAIVGADGRTLEQGRLERDQGLRVPYPGMDLAKVAVVGACALAGNAGWIAAPDLAGATRLRLRVDNYRTFTSRVDLVLAGAGVHVARIAKAGGPDDATFASSVSGGLPGDLPPALVSQIPTGAREWLHFDVQDDGQFLVIDLDVTGRADLVLVRATVDLDNPRRAMLCDESRMNR